MGLRRPARRGRLRHDVVHGCGREISNFSPILLILHIFTGKRRPVCLKARVARGQNTPVWIGRDGSVREKWHGQQAFRRDGRRDDAA